jgi:nucleotide-binding universal stress UspA family protein
VFLGSISHAVLHHATCPVAVIREPDEEHDTD